MNAVRALIFDLDGTLLDSLQDLCLSTNHALLQMGYPQRSLEEVRRFVGNGVHRLIERAVPPGTTPDDLEACFRHFQQHYLLHCQDHTAPYPGIPDMLRQARQRGYRTAIVSNKLQAGVDELYDAHFRQLVDVAIGERPSLRRKPAPDMVLYALRHLRLSPHEALYIGDSEVDVLTAQAAALPCISVLWGFRSRHELEAAGATRFASSPADLLSLLP